MKRNLTHLHRTTERGSIACLLEEEGELTVSCSTLAESGCPSEGALCRPAVAMWMPGVGVAVEVDALDPWEVVERGAGVDSYCTSGLRGVFLLAG